MRNIMTKNLDLEKIMRDKQAKSQCTWDYRFSQEFFKSMRNMESTGILNYLNAQDSRGLTPLHIAVLNKNTDVVILLINIGVNLYLEDNKRNVTKINNNIDTIGLCKKL